jgi:hypothetical protein
VRLNGSEGSERCVQCGYTVPERRMEIVLRGDVMSEHCETLILHKGGCPRLHQNGKNQQ